MKFIHIYKLIRKSNSYLLLLINKIIALQTRWFWNFLARQSGYLLMLDFNFIEFYLLTNFILRWNLYSYLKMQRTPFNKLSRLSCQNLWRIDFLFLDAHKNLSFLNSNIKTYQYQIAKTHYLNLSQCQNTNC